MRRVVSDELLQQARDLTNGLSRAERTAIFDDRSLEDAAANARYPNGRCVKEVVDGMIAEGKEPGFARLDRLGREYARMVARRAVGQKED